MKEKPDTRPADTEANADDTVRLKPLWGISPGRYLAILYGAAILAALFFIFLFPGLWARGAVFAITSEPAGAAVRVDGVYIDRTPCSIIVPAGTRTLRVLMPAFEPFEERLEVRPQLFIRKPFARPEKRAVTLRENAPRAALLRGGRDYAEWSFTGAPSAAYPAPLTLSEGARRSASQPEWDAASKEAARELLLSAARFTASPFALKDLLRAFLYVENEGAAPSPEGLLESLGRAAAALDEEGLFCVLLADVLPGNAAALVLESGLYPQKILDFSEDDRVLNPEKAVFGEAVSAGGMSFRHVRGGSFTQASSFPHTVEIAPFYIGMDEVSAENWAAFTAANPRWRAENAAALESEGLVTSDYLLRTGPPVQAAAGISALAAEAYCAWLTTLLPPALSGYAARLPTEAEWEFVAKTAQERAPARGLPANMTADGGGPGLWEWCANDFAPQNYLPVPDAAARAIPSPQRSVRGGAWVNPRFSVTAETRGSLPPNACSPFVTARLVLAKKAD